MTVLRDWMWACLLVCGYFSFQTSAHAYIVPVDGVTHFTETTTVDGVARNTLWFRPTAASSTKAPLMVMLHFGGGTGESMAYLTEVSLLVRDYGIWVALPDGIGGKWNNDPGNDTGVDDMGFLDLLIVNAVANHPINAKKVYMTGFSNGGFMTVRYACEQPGRLAAAAVVSAGFYKTMDTVCNPSEGTPMAMINGTADPIVKYDATLGLLTAPAAAKRWAGINGCPAAAKRTNEPNTVTSDGTTVYEDTYAGCAQGEVDLFTVNNGGHTWPGSNYNLKYQGKTTFDIDGTLTAWEFVKRFSR